MTKVAASMERVKLHVCPVILFGLFYSRTQGAQSLCGRVRH